MILNRKYYNKVSVLKSWWSQRQVKALKTEKLFKFFNLHKTEWPDKIYFYSPRLKKVPEYIGSKDDLRSYEIPEVIEAVCPTNAIKVKKDKITIDEKGCIACGLCVEKYPELLKMPEFNSTK